MATRTICHLGTTLADRLTQTRPFLASFPKSAQNITTMANIYDEFIIVEEKSSTTDITIQKRCKAECFSEFNELTAFAALEFNLDYGECLVIKDIASHPTLGSGPLAQIVSWKWEGGTQKIEETITLNRGGTATVGYLNLPSIVVRILKKRQMDNPSPLSPDDHLTVHIGDRQITVSASRLRSVSPMVEGMLSVEMKEKQQRALNLGLDGITMEQFMQFLETIYEHLRHGRALPNPTNVLVLLKLADYFQIDWLTERCEAHLINCVEIPLIERFLLIERYRLNILKNFFMRSLNVVNLRQFIKANQEELLSSIGQEFSNQLIVRLCDEQKEDRCPGCRQKQTRGSESSNSTHSTH